MAQVTPNLSLVVWNNLSDPYNSEQLANNFIKLDQHDHSSGRGTQIDGTSGIKSNTIGANQLAANSISSGNIVDGSVGTNELAQGSVTTTKIADLNVTGSKIANATITSDKLVSGVFPALVTTLPGSPVDGDEIYYQTSGMAATGTVWHLRYNSAEATYKWEFLGGSPLYNNVLASSGTVTGTTYTTKSGTTASITPGLTGLFEVSHWAEISIGTANATVKASFSNGATVAAENDRFVTQSAAIGTLMNGYRTTTAIVTNSTDAIASRFAVGTTGTATIAKHGLIVRPIRVI